MVRRSHFLRSLLALAAGGLLSSTLLAADAWPSKSRAWAYSSCRSFTSPSPPNTLALRGRRRSAAENARSAAGKSAFCRASNPVLTCPSNGSTRTGAGLAFDAVPVDAVRLARYCWRISSSSGFALRYSSKYCEVDGGGGGTIAKYVANMNVDVVDLGVPVLSMHAPFEIVSKTDVYMAYRAFFTFFDTKD